MNVAPLNRTLEQELNALLRGASLECLVCGEFVLRLPQGGLFCPECGSGVDEGIALAGVDERGSATESRS